MRPNVCAAVAAALVGMALFGLGAGCAPKPAGEDAAKDSQAAAGTVAGSAGTVHVDDGHPARASVIDMKGAGRSDDRAGGGLGIGGRTVFPGRLRRAGAAGEDDPDEGGRHRRAHVRAHHELLR